MIYLVLMGLNFMGVIVIGIGLLYCRSLYYRLERRHRRLVSATRKLLLAWPSGAGVAATIPGYVLEDVAKALLDEPGCGGLLADVDRWELDRREEP